MTLPELSIKRHVFAVMLNAVLVLFGLIAYERIGMDKLPYVEFPVVSVQTTMKGANPDVVDAAITGVIEGSVNSVPGIEHIQSTSSPGVSQINITFNLDKRIDIAFNEVQAKVNQVLRRLPKDADPPVVAKVETNTSPIFWMAISGDRTQQQLNQYAINIIKKKLETIDGVGEVRVGGRRDRTIRVNLLPARMAAFGIAAQDVQDAFTREHLQVAGGFIVGGATEHLVKLDLEFHNMDDLEKMIVGFRDGAPIRLKDIAEIEDGLSDFRQLARFNGQTAVGLGTVKIPNTNTVAIVERVMDRLRTDIIPSLPPGMKIDVVQNDAVFIGESIRALKEHLFEGTLLASLVVLFFLRSVRSTLIIATAIPVSLLGAVAVMYFFGYTFNSVTMLALLLLIGVVVDDSIVVLENIFRHREHLDPDPISAAMNGSREVTFAVLAATLSLVSIFAPVIFIGGVIGQFFKSFAVVVTFGVLVSWFVSLTLTPMLCSRFLRVHKHEGRVHRWLDRFFAGLDGVYRRLLGFSLRHRWTVLAATLLVSVSSVYFYKNIAKELAPAQDEGRFLITMRTPLGSSIHYTETRLRQVEDIVKQFPEVVTEWGIIGLGSAQQVNQATLVIRMLPKDERRAKGMRSQQQVLATIRRELAQVPGARVFARGFGVFPGQRTEPLQFVVTGPNLQEMGRNATEIQRALQANPSIGRMDTDLQLDLPQLVLAPDRTRSQAFGLSANDVASALNMLTGGIEIAKYNDDPGDGQRYDIRVKAKDGEFLQQADL
ncbi:MAG: efflux RND transporter permease subunit, partial [Burkholderiales bacterium]